jgi:hypothetical protein
MDFKKLKQMVILTDNLEIDDFLRLVRRKVRQYVFSNEFKFDINLTLSTTDYVTIEFNVGSFKCSWSINKKGFICYHNLDCIDELDPYKGFLSSEEEKEFVELFYNKLYKEKDKSTEISTVKKQISELEKVLNMLEEQEE